MALDIISQIREAEQEAEKIVEEASARARRTVLDAEEQAKGREGEGARTEQGGKRDRNTQSACQKEDCRRCRANLHEGYWIWDYQE